MNNRVRLLQTEIRSDLDDIAEALVRLDRIRDRVEDPETAIVVGYYLHVIYGLFETMFRRIATFFAGPVRDDGQWHARLLHRMTLDLPEVRPAVISDELYESLDEPRRFRHLFRNAYVMTLDPDRLAIPLRRAHRVEALYHRDLTAFLGFLDSLATDLPADAPH